MSKIVKKLNTLYTTIDNRVAQSKNLDLVAKGLYFYIVSLKEDWAFSIERLAKANNTTEGKVKSAIAQLEKEGLLERKYTLNADNKRGIKADYIVYDYYTKTENSINENSTPKNSRIEKEGDIINNIYNKTTSQENNISNNLPPYIPPRGEEAKSKSESLFEDDFEVNQSSCLKAKNQNQNNEYSQEFETFWNEYPRRINKKIAFKAFQKALKSKISLEVILEATKAYKSYLKAKRTKSEYIMHPASWLNGECYQNDYESELTLEEVQKQNVMKRGTMGWGSDDDDGIF